MGTKVRLSISGQVSRSSVVELLGEVLSYQSFTMGKLGEMPA